MAYAATTNVSVSKTKGEIDGLLRKYRASGFGVFEEHSRAILVFEMAQRRIVFHFCVADHVKPRIAQAYETQTMTPLLPAPKGDA